MLIAEGSCVKPRKRCNCLKVFLTCRKPKPKHVPLHVDPIVYVCDVICRITINIQLNLCRYLFLKMCLGISKDDTVQLYLALDSKVCWDQLKL